MGNLLICSIFMLLVPIVLSLHEPQRHKLIIEKSYFHKLTDILKFSLLENIQLRWLIVFSSLIYVFNNAGLWLYQPYFQITGISVAYFGILFASFYVVAAISSKYAHKIESKLGAKLSLIVLVPIIFLGYILMSKAVFLFSFVFIFLFQFVRGFSAPVFSDYMNKLASSDNRATVLSIASLGQRLFYAAVVPFIGWIADVYSILQAFMITGVTVLLSGAIILLILHKDNVI